MDPWFVDDSEYIRLWAWLARAPVEDEDARCRRDNMRPRVEAFRPPGVYEGRSAGSVPTAHRLRPVEYRLIP